jgi:hypothetical protein
MLKKSSNILVLIKNEDVKKTIFTACKNEEVAFFSRADRDYSFYDLIVCEEDALEEIGDHNGIILLLKATTKIKQFIGRVNKFIRHGVSYEEFSMFLYIPSEPVLLKIEEDGIEKLVPSGVKELNYGDLYINFEQGIYVYQGKEIYLTKKEKEYLMKFFFTEENLSKDRVVLHRARKKFGKDFLTKRKGERSEEGTDEGTDEEEREFEEEYGDSEGSDPIPERENDEEDGEGEDDEEEFDEEEFDEEFDEDDIFDTEW